MPETYTSERPIFGFDFDGCLGCQTVIMRETPAAELVEIHRPLWNWMRGIPGLENGSYLIASLRNSYSDELHNTWQRGSSFRFYTELAGELEREQGIFLRHNPYLLQDTIRGNGVESLALNRRTAGESFALIKSATDEFKIPYHQISDGEILAKLEGGFHHDKNKIFLLFGQAFQLFEEAAPSERLHYYFVDDIYAEKAYEFYKLNEEFIPPNVVIHFIHYDADFDMRPDAPEAVQAEIEKYGGFTVVEKGVVAGRADEITCKYWKEILFEAVKDLFGQRARFSNLANAVIREALLRARQKVSQKVSLAQAAANAGLYAITRDDMPQGEAADAAAETASAAPYSEDELTSGGCFPS